MECEEVDYKELEGTSQDSFTSQETIAHSATNSSEEFIKLFMHWFYNELQTGIPVESDFWPDISLTVKTVQGPCDETMEDVHGSSSACNFLAHLFHDQAIKFLPNFHFEQGIDFNAERHGLVKMRVSGTVHRQTSCIGTFDHLFGLIEQPNALSSSTWKIKTCQMYIRLQPGNALGGMP